MEVAPSFTNTTKEDAEACFEVTPYWDVVVHCGDMEIKCASVILKIHSEFFNHVISEMTSLDKGIFIKEVSKRIYFHFPLINKIPSDSILFAYM